MEKIFVAARFRPFNESESMINERNLWKINKNSNSIVFNEAMNPRKNNKLPKKEYKFSKIQAKILTYIKNLMKNQDKKFIIFLYTNFFPIKHKNSIFSFGF